MNLVVQQGVFGSEEPVPIPLLKGTDRQRANLLPVLTTLAENFSTIFASVVDTGGKFATGVNETGGKQWEQLSNC
jgi:hypothetical protein